jgi:hypothetical protein
MFEVDLYSQVPFYFKENPNWGGPAVCQMAMNGYPQGATSCYIEQTAIWNYIQANNREPGTGSWGEGWYSDPYAVTKTLNDLCPPTGQWIDVSDTDREKVLYTLLRWMANYKYPAPICLGAHDRWVLLIDYITSEDPRQVTNPELERIGYYYSRGRSEVGASYENAPGDLFFNWDNLWGLPCNGQSCGQIWNNKYVGIGEPPDEEGVVRVEEILRVGEKLINPKKAVFIARKLLKEQRRERLGISSKHLKGIRARSPMLVRELPMRRQKKMAEQISRYYLVPFAQRYEVDEVGIPLTRFCVQVNAYTGRFEGLSEFSRPVRYLQRRDALRIARKNMGLSGRELKKVETELVFQPAKMHVTSSMPAWRIAIKDREIFVTQKGLVLGTLNFRTYKGR